MAQHVALVRAINVLGHARVMMPTLRRAFMSAGCDNVRTVIQSGNVIFETGRMDTETILDAIRAELRQLLGPEAAVLFRSGREFREMVAGSPFVGMARDPEAKLYVSFLSRNPVNTPTFPVRSIKDALEAVGMRDLEVFVVSRQKGNGGYGFPNNFIEPIFQVPATSRNWSTVTKINEAL